MRLLYPALMVLLVFLCGCLEIDETLTLNPDGSGTCELNYSISEQGIVQMKAMLKLKEEMAEAAGDMDGAGREQSTDYTFLFADPVDEQLRLGFRQYEKNGLVLEDVKVDTRDAWRHVKMKISFPGIENLAKKEFFPEHFLSLSRDPEGNYVLELVPKNAEEVPRINDEDTVRQLVPLLSGFKVSFKVNAPGRIIDTNASDKSIRTAMWLFDFDSNPNALPDLQNARMKVIFDGAGLNLPVTE